MPSVKVDKSNLVRTIIPDGVYTLVLVKFLPKLSKNGDSVNLNGVFKVVDHPELEATNATVFDNLNTKFAVGIQDFVHAAGYVLEDGDIPGNFEGPEEDPSKWKYSGPLLGTPVQAEIITRFDQNGNQQNAIKRYICTVDSCAQLYPDVKHSQSLVK